LLHDPRILILDEATSALDTASEREVQKALDTLMGHGPPSPSPIGCPPSSTPTSSMSSTPDAWWNPVPHRFLLRQGGVYASLYQEQFEGGKIQCGAPTATSWPTAPSGTGKHSRRSPCLALQSLGNSGTVHSPIALPARLRRACRLGYAFPQPPARVTIVI